MHGIGAACADYPALRKHSQAKIPLFPHVEKIFAVATYGREWPAAHRMRGTDKGMDAPDRIVIRSALQNLIAAVDIHIRNSHRANPRVVELCQRLLHGGSGREEGVV